MREKMFSGGSGPTQGITKSYQVMRIHEILRNSNFYLKRKKHMLTKGAGICNLHNINVFVPL